MVSQSLEDCAKHLLSYLLAILSRVVAVRKNFRLNNRHESVSLADVSILGKSNSVLVDGQISGASVTNLKNGSPFGKPAAKSVELSSHGGEGF